MQEVPPQVLRLRNSAVTAQLSGVGVDVDILGVGEGLGVAVGVSGSAGVNCAALIAPTLAPLVRLHPKEMIANARIKVFCIVHPLQGYLKK